MGSDNDEPTPKPISTDALIADAMEALQEWAARKDGVRELWLFGSRATGRAGPNSDVEKRRRLMMAWADFSSAS